MPSDLAADDSGPRVSPSLPSEVVTCLQNARYLHLSTCNQMEPHISLMQYTYLRSSPWSTQPTIIMTTTPSSKKTENMISNPRVALLVHDWVTHRPPTLTSSTSAGSRERSPPPATLSGLANLLQQMNTAAMSRISTSINGTARMVPAGSEEESWFKAKHLENNTFHEDDPSAANHARFGSSAFAGDDRDGENGDRELYIEKEEVRVIEVTISDGRIVDYKGGVRDWVVEGSLGS